jgi:hypothetical protein
VRAEGNRLALIVHTIIPGAADYYGKTYATSESPSYGAELAVAAGGDHHERLDVGAQPIGHRHGVAAGRRPFHSSVPVSISNTRR